MTPSPSTLSRLAREGAFSQCAGAMLAIADRRPLVALSHLASAGLYLLCARVAERSLVPLVPMAYREMN